MDKWTEKPSDAKKASRDWKPLVRWTDTNKWFCLVIVAAIYFVATHRYEYLVAGKLLDRWTGTVIHMNELRRPSAARDE